MHRRRLLQGFATIPAMDFAGRGSFAHAAPDSGSAPTPTRIAGIGACDWTLRLAANPASLDLAKKIGLDGVQVDFGQEALPDGSLPLHAPKLQDLFIEKSAALKVAVPSLALGILNRVAYKSDAQAEQWVLDSVAVAQRLQTPVVLLAFFSNGDLRNDEPGIQATIAKLKKLARRAEAAGITYGIESWLKVPVLERILNEVSSSSVKAYYDVGNMQKEGEDIHSAVRVLGRERICEMHMKDYDGLYGQGSMDFSRVKQSLAAIGFTGWMHIEGVKIPNGVEQDVRFDLLHLRSVFGGNAPPGINAHINPSKAGINPV